MLEKTPENQLPQPTIPFWQKLKDFFYPSSNTGLQKPVDLEQAAENQQPHPGPEKPKPQFRYQVEIFTGAGTVKIGVDAADSKEAEQRAMVSYVSRINCKAVLVQPRIKKQ